MTAKTTNKELKEQLKIEKRKSEDKSFYTMLIAFAVALVIELALATLYRKYYAGAYYGFTLRKIMFGFLGVTAAAGIAFIVATVTCKFKYLKPLLAIGAVFFAMAVELRLINTIGLMAIKVGCMACPVILVLFLIYLIYQTEFFMVALVGGLGLFSVWFAKTGLLYPGLFFIRMNVLIGSAIFTAILAILTFIVMKSKGYAGMGKWRFRVFEPKTSYLSLFITYALTLVLLALYFFLELVSYTLILKVVLIAFAAYLFASAIYYTIKLM